MDRENPLRNYLLQLNQQYNLSNEFKSRVAELIERLADLHLAPDQIELLACRVRETYERQVLVESCREESQKSLQKIQSAINAYSNALNTINQRLSHAEATLENVLKTSPTVPKPTPEKAVQPLEREKAKALMAFATISSKNSRIH
ncbi:MAG: hypothetical protein U0V70_09020 [Terriglobia bacterium]